MKTTKYFDHLKVRPDREFIQPAWIQRIIAQPKKKLIQADGRIRLWGNVQEMENRCLSVTLLADGETIHNAFLIGDFNDENALL